MLHPALRAALAVVLLVITLLLHMDLVALGAIALLLFSGYQWIGRRRSTAARNGTVR